MTVEQAIQLAVQHHAAGRLPEAEELYRQVLRTKPSDPTALHNLGQMALSLQRYDLAIDLLQQARAVDSADTNVHNTLGAALIAVGRLREAELACRQAIQLDVHFSHAYANLGNALLAMGDFCRGDRCISKSNQHRSKSFHRARWIGICAAVIR